jgi:ribosome-associated protein
MIREYHFDSSRATGWGLPGRCDGAFPNPLYYNTLMIHSAMLEVTSRVRIPLSELSFSFARSSGPGGQNVNKVNTKALLRWPVLASPSLPDDVRERLLARFARRITAQGDLLVSSQRYRDQGRNVGDCLSKLESMLAEVATPRTVRKPTRPSRSAVGRRLNAKKQQARKKKGRRPPDED